MADSSSNASQSHQPTGPIGPEELGWLVDQHGRALELYARQFCDAAEDVVQEAFIELIRQHESPQDAAPWLYRVVRNRAVSAGRKDRRRKDRERRVAADRPAADEDAKTMCAADDGPDAESASEALSRLAPELAEIVIAHIWGKMTFEQIGEVLGVSASTAHRRYQDALERLREVM